MELTDELKLLLVKTTPHTSAQAVVDNIKNTVEIDEDEAWSSRLDKYIKDKDLGTWTGASPDQVYTEPTTAELKASLLANPYVPITTASIWELEGYESETDYTAKQYSRDRKAKYDLLNQDEMRFDDQVNGTTTWVDAINAIKAAHPKPQKRHKMTRAKDISKIVSDANFEGTLDIDGTTNLDAVDIDGAVQMGASDDDVRMTLQGNNQYRLALKNAANAIVYLGSGGANNFRVSNSAGSTLLELTSASNILLPTASAGIYLGVTSEATSNLLDDYEEGTWTASLYGTTSGAGTNVTATGNYVKVGKVVTVGVYLPSMNLSSMSGSTVIGGLPFTSGAGLNTGSVTLYGFTFSGFVTPYVYNSTTTVDILNIVSNGAWEGLAIPAAAGKYVMLGVTYQTAQFI